MRAVVLTGVNRLELRDVPSPLSRRTRGVCASRRLDCAGRICTSWRDMRTTTETRMAVIPFAEEPQILGHEIAGVEDIGRDVADLHAGDRVIIDQGRNCVSEHRSPLCEFCATGDSHQCERYREHGITGLPGGFAEYVTVPAVNAVRIESAVDIAEAALAEPLACVVHSTDLLTRADARYTLAASNGQAVARQSSGAGPSGLLFVQYLRRVLSRSTGACSWWSLTPSAGAGRAFRGRDDRSCRR